mgnify:CR=1 FL=1
MSQKIKVRIIESLLLFNSYNLDECKEHLKYWIQEEDLAHSKILMKIIEIIESIRDENFESEEIEVLLDMLSKMEDTIFNNKFKEMINQVLEDFRRPLLMGFPKKKIILNWQEII